jgi:hypothetical protein
MACRGRRSVDVTRVCCGAHLCHTADNCRSARLCHRTKRVVMVLGSDGAGHSTLEKAYGYAPVAVTPPRRPSENAGAASAMSVTALSAIVPLAAESLGLAEASPSLSATSGVCVCATVWWWWWGGGGGQTWCCGIANKCHNAHTCVCPCRPNFLLQYLSQVRQTFLHCGTTCIPDLRLFTCFFRSSPKICVLRSVLESCSRLENTS